MNDGDSLSIKKVAHTNAADTNPFMGHLILRLNHRRCLEGAVLQEIQTLATLNFVSTRLPKKIQGETYV